jgi:hypothetical protein
VITLLMLLFGAFCVWYGMESGKGGTVVIGHVWLVGSVLHGALS